MFFVINYVIDLSEMILMKSVSRCYCKLELKIILINNNKRASISFTRLFDVEKMMKSQSSLCSLTYLSSDSCFEEEIRLIDNRRHLKRRQGF